MIVAFLIAGSIEAIAKSVSMNIENVASLIPAAIIVPILAGIFFFVKKVSKRMNTHANETSHPIEVKYLVALTAFVGFYSIGQEIMTSPIGVGTVVIFLFAGLYFLIASQLWTGKSWAWTASVILASVQVVTGVSLLETSAWQVVATVPLIVNLVIIFMLIEQKTLKFYKKEHYGEIYRIFTKYFQQE